MQAKRIHAMSSVMGEAMPYIEKYKGKTIVVKYGGAAMTSAELKATVMSDIILLNLIGVRVVLVHGGGPAISEQLKKLGKKSEFIGGLRVTDEETMEVVQQTLAGKVNKDLVSLLHGKGVGLCGLDGGMITCSKIQTEPDLGYVGEVEHIDNTLLNFTLDAGFIPVIATIGAGEDDRAYNINADTAACAIAVSLHADKIITMTDVAGLLKNKDDESTLIPEADIKEVPDMIASGVIAGGMIPKILGCVECIKQGVNEATILDGRVPHSILLEIFSDEGNGTLFYQKDKGKGE